MKLSKVITDDAPAAEKARSLMVRVYLHGAAAILRKFREAAGESHLPVRPRIAVGDAAVRLPRRDAAPKRRAG